MHLWQRPACPCETAQEEQEKRRCEEARDRRQAELHRLRVRSCRECSGLYGDLLDKSFESYRPQSPSARTARDACMRFAEAFPEVSQGLVLCSPPTASATGNGSGKTHLACAVANALIERGFAALFYETWELFEAMKREFGREESERTVMARCKEADLLVLDDLGKETVRAGEAGDWARGQLLQLINYRANTRRPLIVTTNKTVEELQEHIGGDHGPAIVSRLAGLCRWHLLHAPDGRLARGGGP